MENKYRNEQEIKLGNETILLRPTFENIAATENNVGAVSWLGWKYSRGLTLDENGKVKISDSAMKSLPSVSECAQIIYFNQAATKPEDPTKKKYNLEEIFQLCMVEGSIRVGNMIVIYLAKLTAGNKSTEKLEVTEAEKKS